MRGNASPGHAHRSLNELFRGVALSVLLRNGDAHLKNFGLLYTDPEADDCRLSPVYDLVCTTVFIPPDRLALTLAGSRAWPTRRTLCEFGRRHCQVDDPEGEVDRLLAAALDYRPADGVPVPARQDAPGGLWRALRREVEAAAVALAR